MDRPVDLPPRAPSEDVDVPPVDGGVLPADDAVPRSSDAQIPQTAMSTLLTTATVAAYVKEHLRGLADLPIDLDAELAALEPADEVTLVVVPRG